MNKMINYDNEEKNETREILFGSILNRPSRSILTLAGGEARCVQEMYKLNVTDADTHQTWVEKDPIEFSRMLKTRERFFAEGIAKRGNIALIRQDITKFNPDRMYDLVNLDLMSGITPEIGLWLSTKLAHHLLPRATVLVTNTYWSRSPIFKWLRENFEALYPFELEHIRNHYDTIDAYVETSIMLFLCAFSGFKIEQMPYIIYSGSGTTIPMVTISYEQIFRGAPTRWPTFQSIIARFSEDTSADNSDNEQPFCVSDLRDRFNLWLSQSYMTLQRERNKEVLYHYHGKIIKLQQFDDLTSAVAKFEFDPY